MSVARFFTDEDVFAAIAVGLRKAGFDAVSTPEVGRLGEPDDAQLQWATLDGRTLVSFNVAHFASLHARWLSSGKHHAGVVVSSQRPIGDLLRRLIRLARQLDAESLTDQLEYLSDW